MEGFCWNQENVFGEKKQSSSGAVAWVEGLARARMSLSLLLWPFFLPQWWPGERSWLAHAKGLVWGQRLLLQGKLADWLDTARSGRLLELAAWELELLIGWRAAGGDDWLAGWLNACCERWIAFWLTGYHSRASSGCLRGSLAICDIQLFCPVFYEQTSLTVYKKLSVQAVKWVSNSIRVWLHTSQAHLSLWSFIYSVLLLWICNPSCISQPSLATLSA